jgi:hypothetical protein
MAAAKIALAGAGAPSAHPELVLVMGGSRAVLRLPLLLNQSGLSASAKCDPVSAPGALCGLGVPV